MSRCEISLFRTKEDLAYLVVPSPTQSITYIFILDLINGSLIFQEIPQIFIFQSPQSAYSYINSILQGIQPEYLGKALIGVTVEQHHFIIVTVMNDSLIGQIFNKNVYSITEVKYTSLPLRSYPIDSETQKSPDININLNNNHFYSHSLDFTSPLPTTEFLDPKSDFIWNKKFSAPFKHCNVCIRMFQGSVSIYQTNVIIFILKRSCGNPGTRMLARGVNSSGKPANECESTLIFKDRHYVWRRGSIPLKWKTEGSPSNQMHILLENRDEFTYPYFKSLFERFGIREMVVVSLLKYKSKKESVLTNAYRESLSTLPLKISFETFDMNTKIKDENYTDLFLTLLEKYPYSTFFRFNCVDSIDRTNVACYLYALHLISDFYQVGYKKLQPEIISFLKSAVIKSGNIVAQMYTDTDAMKSKRILNHNLFTSLLSDGLLSVQRIVSNKNSDPKRNKKLLKWVASPRLSTIHLISNYSYLAKDAYFTAVLYESSIFQGVSFYLCTNEPCFSLKILTGNSPQEFHLFTDYLIVPKVSREGWYLFKPDFYEPLSISPAKIIQLRFLSNPLPNNRIRILARTPKGRIRKVIRDVDSLHFPSVPPQDLTSVVGLEMIRLELGVSDYNRDLFFLNFKTNPVFYSLASIFEMSHSKKCAFCNQEPKVCFNIHPQFPFLLCKSDVGKSVCSECASFLDSIVVSEHNLAIINETPSNPLIHFQGFSSDLTEYCSIFPGEKKSVSTEDFSSENEFLFTFFVFFFYCCDIQSIVIEFEGKIEKLQLIPPQGDELKYSLNFEDVGSSKYLVEANQQLMYLKIIMFGKDINVKKFHFNGVVGNAYQPFHSSALKVTTELIKEMAYEWDPASRTQVVEVTGPIKEIQLKNSNFVQKMKIIFSFECEDSSPTMKILYTPHLQLPTILSYSFDDLPNPCSLLRIYYLEPLQTIEPFHVSIIYLLEEETCQ